MASELACHQFMLHEKKIVFWKLQAVVVLPVPKEPKFEVITASIIVSCLHDFGDVEKELFRYYSSPAD